MVSSQNQTHILAHLHNLFAHAAPYLANFQYCVPLTLTLGENQSENYHLHTTPVEFTLEVLVNETVSVYGSFKERNPNAITADFTLEGLFPLQYYVNNNRMDLFLTITSSSSNALVEINKKFYDATSVGKTKPSTALHSAVSQLITTILYACIVLSLKSTLLIRSLGIHIFNSKTYLPIFYYQTPVIFLFL